MSPLLIFSYTALMGLCLCWDLDLVHVNDIHVRMEETNKHSAACGTEDKKKGKCYGGLARLQTAVKELRSQSKNLLWVNAGDFYQGTVWYSHFKWRVVARFNNLLNFDAITLGNHELDDGVEGLVPFLRNQSSPCVVSNIDISQTPDLAGLTRPSVVLTVGERKVGIVGYLTQETTEVSNPGKLVITEEISAVRREAERLEREGVDIILGLGHSGYEKDLEIAEKVPQIDAVIGGHTHSFLYSVKKKNPSNNIIEGPYPTIVTKTNGKKAAVVQAFAYTKYLGQIRLTFDPAGHLVSWAGSPKLLDGKIKEDEEIRAELLNWKYELNKIGKDLVGFTAVVLFNSREKECNMGNFVTDAMVWAYRNQAGDPVSLALINSGGIKGFIDQGNITMENLLISFPFRNTFDVVLIKGLFLRQAFEHSVASMESDGRNEAGRFLQENIFTVSGFKLQYDLTKPTGQRLRSVQVPCKADCDGAETTELRDEEVYSVVMTDYLAGGGDGFNVIKHKKERQLQGPLDTDIFKEYMKVMKPIETKVEGRIRIATRSVPDESSGVGRWGQGPVLLLSSLVLAAHPN